MPASRHAQRLFLGVYAIANNGEGRFTGLLAQGWSKLSRFWLVKARRGYVVANRAKRSGECRRCGTCCRVFVKCIFLAGNSCRIYGLRFDQCRAFPIDTNDIDLVRDMGSKCGFEFEEKES